MSQNNIPLIEIFWSLVDKADKKFTRVRDLPSYGRNRYDAYFFKVFKVYTQLWKFQQENRQKLVEAGLKRWEIGEIASRIAQLYYGQYLRTSEANYLSESYIFYEAILTREYFKDGASQSLNLATKQLRFLARFLIVCLVLNRREMVNQLVSQLRTLVDECKRTFQETDFKEWKQVVQEIASPEAKRGLRLRDAILSSYHHNEVKFTELTLDTFRMLQCLEWESSGSFYPKRESDTNGNDSNIGQNGAGGPHCATHLPEIKDYALPPNPRKAILYRPSVTHFIAVLATVCDELPPDGILLIYLSAPGKGGEIIPFPSGSRTSEITTENTVGNFQYLDLAIDAHLSSPMSSPRNSPAHSSAQNKGNYKSSSGGCLWLGSRANGGLNCLYPCDLLPFTRRPLFLIIDSDSSQAFKAIHGTEKGETVAMLLSSSSPPPVSAAGDSARHINGSQFTMFLTAPLQAFCLLLGLSASNIEMVSLSRMFQEVYNKAEQLLSSSLNDWGLALAASDTLDPVWAQVLCDPFLRRLLLRFIFCRAVTALHVPTFNKKECLPECLPHLPESVLPSDAAIQSVIQQLASAFCATDNFVFSDGITFPENKHSPEEPMVVTSSDVHEPRLAANGH
ncbi:signal transducer, putative (DUF3550/UPF0682) isoform X2 [Tasmannia lanceolata]|uniref:signal transducer, putative (DUF3550/UPF0682) isoform X2 n=1 Tax=Tasmannia lanceolata TaxID=3420 RepID=UPI0040639754